MELLTATAGTRQQPKVPGIAFELEHLFSADHFRLQMPRSPSAADTPYKPLSYFYSRSEENHPCLDCDYAFLLEGDERPRPR